MELRKCRTEIIIRYLYNCIVSFFCSDCKTKLLFRGCFFHNPTPGGYFLPNLCAQPRQKPVKVCISAPDKLHPAKAAAAPGSQCRKRQRRTGPLHSSEAASSGSTLFLAAGTSTLPCKGRPPVMIQSPAMPRPPFCKRYPMVCKTRVFGQQNAPETAFPQSAGFVRSFVRFFSHFRAAPALPRQEIQPFISFRPGTPKARCPSRPKASSGWCRRRRKRVD